MIEGRENIEHSNKIEHPENVEHSNQTNNIRQVIEVHEIGEKEGHPFAKGVVTGLLSAVFFLLISIAVWIFWLNGRISTGSAMGGAGGSANIIDNSVRAKVNELAGVINEYYYEDVDEEDLTDGLYKGLFASLGDPYSAYYTKEEYEEMMISASAQYYGIGAVLQQDKDTMQVQIKKIYDDTPAMEAGLEEGDIVVSVEDIDARSMELSELVTHIRGEENSRVHIVILRQGEEEEREYDVRRGKVDVPTVDSRILEDEVGYIIIAEFGEATAEDFKQHVEKLEKRGMKKLVVDLRDNPGGMMSSVSEILDYILPEGVIVYTEDKYGNRQELKSDAEHCLNLPMAVLINGNSASCSEIFAGAIRDYDYGTLIGTTTYGKGVVQTVRPLTDQSAIKLTTARYFTPKGENIHGTGIDPDIELKYKYTGKRSGEYDYTKDNQVRRAVSILKEQ